MSRKSHGSIHKSGSLRLLEGKPRYTRLLSVRLWFVAALALDPAYQHGFHLEPWWGLWGRCWSRWIGGFFDKKTSIKRIWQVRKEISFVLVKKWPRTEGVGDPPGRVTHRNANAAPSRWPRNCWQLARRIVGV